MAWSSFTDILDLVRAALEGNAGLTSFCNASWNRPQSVKRTFKRREEISLTDIPLIMITAPAQANEYGAGRLLYRTHTIRLYSGFQQEDRSKSQDQIIQFSELIDQAILLDANLNGQAIEVTPGDSANDEGWFHPVYFIVKEYKILISREV